MDSSVAPGARSGSVTVPSSKSVVHRLLITAALGRRESVIRFRGLSKDISATAACLRAMGAGIRTGSDEIRVTPIPDRADAGRAEPVTLPCGESGSTLRFLLPLMGALGLSGAFRMEGRLPERPMEAYEAVLRDHGMLLSREGSSLFCSGRLRPGDYRLPGDISSQYFTGLLFALPLLRGDSTLSAEGALESADYIRLTEDCLLRAGVTMRRDGASWALPGGQRPAMPERTDAEGDWSSAAFFLCLGAFSGGGVTVSGLRPDSLQGDRAVLDTLEAFGACILRRDDRVTVSAAERKPFVLDARAVPDLVPVLSVLACGARGESRIVNAARLRLKESDRLQATAQLIRDLGGDAEELPDGLIIRGTGALRGGRVDSKKDHRIAMSAAVASALCAGAVTVTGSECTDKSYPDFWEDFSRLERSTES